MGCSDFKQIRLGEFLNYNFDTAGEFEQDPLSLGDAVDVGAAKSVAVTITALNASLNNGSVSFDFMTAPINNEAYYSKVEGDTAISIDTSSAEAVAYFKTTDKLSRFFFIKARTTSNPTSDATLSCTIDLVVRGCGG